MNAYISPVSSAERFLDVHCAEIKATLLHAVRKTI